MPKYRRRTRKKGGQLSPETQQKLNQLTELPTQQELIQFMTENDIKKVLLKLFHF